MILALQRIGIVLMVMGTTVLLVLAYLIGTYFSRAITGFREAVAAVNQGDFAVQLRPVMGGEVGELTQDFNRMVGKLAATTVSKQRLEQSEQMLRKANLVLQGEIEKRLEAESKLKAHGRQLAEQAAALEKANRELQELDRLKDSFLSSVSHEFRTPLTAIRSFIDILLAYPEEEFEQKKEFLSIIRAESERLTRLVNNVLDFSKIQAGRMEYRFRRVLLDKVAHNALQSLWGLFARKDLKVYEEIDSGLPEVEADEDRLLQVLTNLLSNSIKFTPQGGEVHLRVNLHRADGHPGESDQVHIEVSDTGIGIPPQDLPFIFDLFRQAHNSLDDIQRGSGLGLSIAREIIHAHKGRIWAESEFGKGSTLHIHLPAA
jgi:signal transduction histidine kinase